ncbi:Gluconate transport-inducing protein [Entomophthora muscae]|uniref:Gluconate transport-inducing protein n=1 Tax=Entomophthora muscae TaxID=34485 RepID=A0ACC2SEC4_9FUNG|nr:Gluconate transport-inducing protein [Entomophthora muscae]
MLNMEFVSLETSQPQQEGGLLSFETYFGYIESVSDAERVIAAVKAGQLRQTFVRLSQRDQGLIRSGTVIVWEEGLSGIQRWTDGRTWSASRFQDEFLIYQELPPKPGSSKPRPFDGGLRKRAISIQDRQGKRYHLTNYYYPKDAEACLLRPYDDPRFAPKRALQSDMLSESTPILRFRPEHTYRMSLPPLDHLLVHVKPSYHAEDLRQLDLINCHRSL